MRTNAGIEGLVEVPLGAATETQTGRSAAPTNPLKSLISKAGDFLRYSPALENVGHSESDFGRMGLAALPSFHRNTVQMLGFSEA